MVKQQGLMVVQAGPRVGGPDVCMGVVLQAAGVDAGSRSVRATVVNGAPARMVVMDWSRGEAIENVFVMEGAKLPERVSLLESHSTYTTEAIRGSAVDFVVVGSGARKRLDARLEFAEDAASEAAWLKARDGHLNAVSIGARITKHAYVEPGESAEVEGVTYKAGRLPLRVNLEWEPVEVSLVVFGADPGARVIPGAGKKVAAAKAGARSEQAMKFMKAVLVQMGLVSADADEAAVNAAQAALNAEQLVVVQAAVAVAEASNGQGTGGNGQGVTGGTPVVQGGAGAGVNPQQFGVGKAPVAQGGAEPLDAAAVAQAAVVAERARVSGIRAAAEGTGLDAAVVQGAIDAGLTVEQAGLKFLAAVRALRVEPGVGNVSQSGAGGVGVFNVNTGAGRAELQQAALSAALCDTMGTVYADPKATGSVKQQEERVMEEAGRFRGLGLLEMARQSLMLGGVLPAVSRTEMVQQAFSNTDFSNSLANTIGRVLMARFDVAGDSTAGLFFEEDLPDYKLVSRIAVDPQSQLDPLPEGGTANHANGTDDKETYQLARYAKQMVVDEILVINDDIGVIERNLQSMADAAARLRPDLVYAIINSNPTLRDTVALFHATHNNTTTGALAAATLQTAITKMTKQYITKDGQKIPLNLRPAHLLVPADLEFTALQLMNSVERGDTAGNGTANVLRGRLNVVVDDRLGVNGARHPYTGTVHAGTATNYYLLAPNTANTLSVGYLQGTGRRPMVRRFALDRGQYGVGVDVKHVIGAKAMSWQGWVKSTGA